jgi:hypothetical protein
MAIPPTIAAMNFRAPCRYSSTRKRGAKTVRLNPIAVCRGNLFRLQKISSKRKKGPQVTADEFVTDIQHWRFSVAITVSRKISVHYRDAYRLVAGTLQLHFDP